LLAAAVQLAKRAIFGCRAPRSGAIVSLASVRPASTSSRNAAPPIATSAGTKLSHGGGMSLFEPTELHRPKGPRHRLQRLGTPTGLLDPPAFFEEVGRGRGGTATVFATGSVAASIGLRFKSSPMCTK